MTLFDIMPSFWVLASAALALMWLFGGDIAGLTLASALLSFGASLLCLPMFIQSLVFFVSLSLFFLLYALLPLQKRKSYAIMLSDSTVCYGGEIYGCEARDPLFSSSEGDVFLSLRMPDGALCLFRE